MKISKKVVTDLLFWVQIAAAPFFAGSEFLNLLKKGVHEGVSVVMFLSLFAFICLNLVLQVRAHRVMPTRITRQTIAVYLWWTVLWGANVVYVVIALAKNPHAVWTRNDNLALISVLVGLFLVVAENRMRKASLLEDPMTKGYSALVFKAVPQFFQGWKFWVYGPGSWTALAVGVGHLTVLTRIAQLYFSIKEAGWDKNRTGSMVSEVGNEISWIFATAIWIIRR